MPCKTCKHNAYRDIENCKFACCAHPVTIAKTPKPQAGDPIFVNAMTADIPLSELQDECPTYEA